LITLTAQVSLTRAAAGCPTGNICLWRDRNFDGVPWKWSPGDGYRTLPANMRNHVHSFYANASGCFIDTGSRERRGVRPGHYARAYDTNFGEKVDAIARTC
jgi:hypothetical protein